MSESRAFEIHVGVTGRTSKVLFDGEVVPRVRRVLIDCGVDQVTRLEIHAYKADGEPYVIKGRMVEETATLPTDWKAQSKEVRQQIDVSLPGDEIPMLIPGKLLGWKLRDGRFVSVEEVAMGLVP